MSKEATHSSVHLHDTHRQHDPEVSTRATGHLLRQSNPQDRALATPINGNTKSAGLGIELDENAFGNNLTAAATQAPSASGNANNSSTWIPYVSMTTDDYSAHVVMHWMYLILLAFVVLLIVGGILIWSNYQTFSSLDLAAPARPRW